MMPSGFQDSSTADIANELANFVFFSLVAGVILQALTTRRRLTEEKADTIVQ